MYLKATLAGIGSTTLAALFFVVLMMSQTRTAGVGAIVGYTIGNPVFWLTGIVAFGLGFWFAKS